ncbi:B3 DNA binding domain [Dillenia turbinata]|uniref:B3 DNA binding domain n=1 Tax=Dillenia turbinata TaxID=194707 RepID=A0AAN8W4Z7_9MAGN
MVGPNHEEMLVSDTSSFLLSLVAMNVIFCHSQRIPEHFVKKFGKKLSAHTLLTTPNGRIWRVGLKNDENGLWFSHGWNLFTKYYSIGFTFFLLFKYEGNSSFTVRIFDVTASEICYPLELRLHSASEESQHPTKIAAASQSTHPQFQNQAYKEIKLDEQKPTTKHNDKVEILDGMSRPAKFQNKMKAIDMAKMFKTKNPTFIYLDGHPEFINLKVSEERKWIVWCLYKDDFVWKLGKGWVTFALDNKLEEGDASVFELVQADLELKVNIFRAVDHWGQQPNPILINT